MFPLHSLLGAGGLSIQQPTPWCEINIEEVTNMATIIPMVSRRWRRSDDVHAALGGHVTVSESYLVKDLLSRMPKDCDSDMIARVLKRLRHAITCWSAGGRDTPKFWCSRTIRALVANDPAAKVVMLPLFLVKTSWLYEPYRTQHREFASFIESLEEQGRRGPQEIIRSRL